MEFKRSNKDWQQTLVYSHNDDTNAMRVEVVGGGDIAGSVKEGLVEAMKGFKIDLSTPPTTAPGCIEIPKIITEVQIKEVPVIVKEIEIREIQVPIIVKEYQIHESVLPVVKTEIQYIDRPIIVEKTTTSDNKVLNKLILIQTICLILLSLVLCIK
jgi:hypothetical protein